MKLVWVIHLLDRQLISKCELCNTSSSCMLVYFLCTHGSALQYSCNKYVTNCYKLILQLINQIYSKY